MRVSADALWFHVDVAIEPRDRAVRAAALQGKAAALRGWVTRLTKVAMVRPSRELLDDTDRRLLADMGLQSDGMPRRRARDDHFDLALRLMVPF